MVFKVGDWVVHSRHGVGRIAKTEARQFEPGKTRLYYEIAISGSTLWVPVDFHPVSLRKLATRSEIARGRRLLKSPAVPLNADPRQRQSDLAECLLQGTFAARCEVVRDLTAHARHKSLGGEMASLLHSTQAVLSQEWAAVEGISVTDAGREIDMLLQAGRRMQGG